MISVTYGSTLKAYLTTEENRINNSVSSANIRYLCKFTNDMSKAVVYAYGQHQTIKERYTYLEIDHNTTENVFTGRINFKPNGYWKYEIYEVSWIGTVALDTEQAPATEIQVLEVGTGNGVVQGKVEEGKLFVEETSGSEEVQYVKHTSTETNYIYTK